MTKKNFNFRLLLTVGMATVVFNSCGNLGGSNNSSTTDTGVVINGVKWATCNVGVPGTFAANPESPGMLYQWNRKQAWSAAGTITGWDNTAPAGTEWEKSNDPSPKGWRVPTTEEQQTLFHAGKVTNEWTTQNGVTGRKFTDIATGNSLFLPAVGQRDGSDGTLNYADTIGNYWSSTASKPDAVYLLFTSTFADWGISARHFGLSVRAVAE